MRKAGVVRTFLTVASAILVNVGLAAKPSTPGDAFRSGDFARTLELLVPQAEAGMVDAQIMLGQMYLNGQGVQPDTGKAIEWIRKAAVQGSPIAAYDLGLFSLNGIGGPKDIAAAAVWFAKAAHQHFADGAYNLAVFYHKGVGVQRNDALALSWIKAGMDYLPASAGAALKNRFSELRESIAAGMPVEDVARAARLTAREAPMPFMHFRNLKQLQSLGAKSYPLGLRSLGRGGTVVILGLVDKNGSVKESFVETSSGFPEIDAAAANLLESAQVETPLDDGRPAESWQILKWTWRVNEEPWNSFHNLNALARPR